MSRYLVELTPAAARQLRKLPRDAAPRIRGVIDLLAVDPRPPTSRPLRGRPAYRVRSGDYRVIYTIEDDRLLVVIIRLGHRRDVYRQG
jgi:mRNA interferase RelE/StbE